MGRKKKALTEKIEIEDTEKIEIENNIKASLSPMPYQDEETPERSETKKEKDDRDNCNLCRWKRQIEKTGICPSIKKSVDLKNPVYDCEKFRRFEGTYY